MPCVKTIQINVNPVEIYVYEHGNWSPRDPSGVATSFDVIHVISGAAVISASTVSNKVIVEPGAALTVNNGVLLTVNNTNLNSRSNSYAGLIVEGEFLGDVNYNLYVNRIGTSAGGGNDLITAPVSGVIFNYTISKNNIRNNKIFATLDISYQRASLKLSPIDQSVFSADQAVTVS